MSARARLMHWLRAMVSLLLAAFTLAMATLTLIFSIMWFQRSQLAYNEQGRHFDAAASVVYDGYAVPIYAILALLSGASTIAAAFVTRRSWARQPPATGALPSPEPRIYNPHSANVPGPVYVENGCCLGCGVWQDVAGDYLAWDEDGDGSHCYVRRQPVDDREFDAIVAAMKMQEIDCIRLRGGPANWRARLIAEGEGNFVDDS